MAVFRVEKTKDYTVMSNHHLRNVALSLKAKGLMSLMLSLPEDWDYTLKGLACICKDGVDSISATIKELERHGYLSRKRLRLPNGRLGDIEYTIHEQPETPVTEPNLPKREDPEQVNPVLEKPTLVSPIQAQPALENPAQLNTYQSKTKKSNTKEIKDKIDKIGVRAYRELIEDNIEYDALAERYGAERLDAIVDLMLETVVSQSPYCVIAGGEFPREVVKARILKINSAHIEYVFDCLDGITSKVFCGYCDHAMSRKGKNAVFYCRHSEVSGNLPCYGLQIKAADLEKVIFDTLRAQLLPVLGIDADKDNVTVQTMQQVEYESKLQSLRDKKRMLYEQYVFDEIDLDAYKAQKDSLDAEVVNAKNAYTAISARTKQAEADYELRQKQQATARELSDAKSLTQSLSDRLISRVYIFKDNRIEIDYICNDFLAPN